MPATRRSNSGPRSSGAGGKQATLSFNNRVTKPVPKSSKNLVSSTTPTKASPLSKHVSSAADPAAEDVAEIEEPESLEAKVEEEVVEEVPEKSQAEKIAAKISERQIGTYWKKLEGERNAPRVHQADLTLAEKVLRYFDVSSQYGPCVGIDRMKRWQRAERLGLNPPVEVLAVLLKEEGKGTEGIETAHIDKILNSTAVVV
ncbi:DNA polymerase delta, subunit 4-domain-containing protein [Xylariales sp. AK1849]|nr:DNA polymerase delta, subunit 4-domain-containing protein [Xylariales sp. AK1849]